MIDPFEVDQCNLWVTNLSNIGRINNVVFTGFSFFDFGMNNLKKKFTSEINLCFLSFFENMVLENMLLRRKF